MLPYNHHHHHNNNNNNNNNPADNVSQASSASNNGLRCSVCKKTFASSHNPLKCIVVGCESWTHTGPKCSKIKRGSPLNWYCIAHRDQEDIPPPSQEVAFETGTMCPCKIVIKQGTKPVRCTDCCTLYHKRCTGLSRDSQDAAADGLIRWYCDKCHSLREKENEDITPNIHLEDAPESLSQTIKKNVLSVVNAWGVKGKLDELEERLNKDEIDICLIQETKLKEGRDKTPVIPGYKFIRSDRTGASGGGLAILVKKNISYKEVKRAQKGGTEILVRLD